MSKFRTAVRARVTALASAVGVLALMALVLLAANGHFSPGGEFAGSGAGQSSGGKSTPAPSSPSATAPLDPAQLRRLVADVRCPQSSMPANAGPHDLAGFDAVAAVACSVMQPGGLGGTAPMQVRKASADIEGLVDALRQPDAPRDPSRLCPMIEWAGPALILVDRQGATLLPRYPRDACGLPQSAVLRALNTTSWTVLSRQPAR